MFGVHLVKRLSVLDARVKVCVKDVNIQREHLRRMRGISNSIKTLRPFFKFRVILFIAHI